MTACVTLADGARSPDLRLAASRLRKPEHGRFALQSARNSYTSLAAPSVPVTPTGNSSPMALDLAAAATTDPSDGVFTTSSAPGGRIRVAVRVRPLPAGEQGIIEVAGEGVIAIRKEAATGGNQFLATQQGRIEERQFDRVFGPSAGQEDVYAWTCEPLIEQAMTEGRNVTVFVYGATGAGKTHTMFGNEDEDEQGIIFRTMRDVFAQIDAQKLDSPSNDDCLDACDVEDGERLEVRVSLLELYNENVRDLLQDGSGATPLCRVFEDERRGVVQVSNLVEVPVRSVEEAFCLLRAGMEARTVEATAANAVSSRAHAVFSLSVERVGGRQQRKGLFKSQNPEARVLHSKISLIDLAGSERAKDTHNSGSALKDGARINQSLLALANCIDALTAKGKSDSSRAVLPSQKKKPPYRDSKLTLMLKGSLTGDGLVAMVANVHPGRSHFEDSNNTLEYAMRATSVKPREQRRCRTSLVGMRPSGIPQASAAQASRRCSMPAFPSGRRASTDEEEDRCKASSSTLPAPQFSARHSRQTGGTTLSNRTKLDPKKAFAWVTQPQEEAEAPLEADSTESSASSPATLDTKCTHGQLCAAQLRADGMPVDSSPPDECLSELSLPSDEVAASLLLLDEDEYSSDGDHGCMETCFEESLPALGVCDEATIDELLATYETYVLSPPEKDIAGQSSAGHTPSKGLESAGHTPSRKKPVAKEARDMSSPSSAKDSMVIPAFAAKIITQLQAEKVDLDERIHCITSERDALLQDRADLELTNARLREANLEKDRQLASMLFGPATE